MDNSKDLPPEIIDAFKVATNTLVPQKSKERYKQEFKVFEDWCNQTKVSNRRPVPKLHEVLKNTAFLIGKWKSLAAQVEYPTMKALVKFNETLEFRSLGQPLLNYNSTTTHPVNGGVMHLEAGFLRVDDDKCTVAFLTAQNFGLATLEEGYVKDNHMVVATACIGIMKFAKQTVMSVHRSYKLNEKGQLEYIAMMETIHTPLTKHVSAVYEKVKEEPRPGDCKPENAYFKLPF